MISNGCYWSQDESAMVRELLSDVVEKVYNERCVDLKIIAHALFDDSLDSAISDASDEILLETS